MLSWLLFRALDLNVLGAAAARDGIIWRDIAWGPRQPPNRVLATRPRIRGLGS